MKVKLDENLPKRLVPVLTALGHDVDTVHGEQLTGRADPDVWSAAQSTQRFLVTQESRFFGRAPVHARGARGPSARSLAETRSERIT